MGFIWFLKCWYTTDELDNMWGVEIHLVEESYGKGVESRGIDPCYEVVQVFAGPLELKTSEIREDRACHRRRTSAFLVRA
jgi:hypothetical protein